MKKIIIILILNFILINNKIIADNVTEITGFRATMANINPIIESSVNILQDAFNQNKGAILQKNITVLQNNTHDLIETVTIMRNYKIIVSFKKQFIPKLNTFMPSYLQGKYIVFAPIIVKILDNSKEDIKSDTKSEFVGMQGLTNVTINSQQSEIQKQKIIISGFNCATNIDENINMIMGQAISIEKERSILAHLTKDSDSKYYGNCIYLKNEGLINFINSK